MNLAMFHDWIIWKKGPEYFLDDAFVKFVLAFNQDFEKITFCGRVKASHEANSLLYPLDSNRHQVCPFPHYNSIYSLYLKGFYIFPQVIKRLYHHLDQWDLLWLEAPHPISILAAFLCRLKGKPFFFLVRQNLKEQVRHRNTGLKRIISIILVYLLEGLSKKISKNSITFTVGEEMYRSYQKQKPFISPVLISLVSEKDLPDDSSIKSDIKSDFLHDPIKLLSIGRLDPEKGLQYLIDAVDGFLKRHKVNLLLTIVGKGKEEAKLKKKVKEKGLTKHIRFLGYIKNGPDLYHLYQHHDFFVLPSLTGEGLPQTILEAMAWKIPIIATCVEGIPFLVHHQSNGWLIPPANSIAITEAINSLRNNNTLRKKIIAGGVKTIYSHTMEKEKEKMMIQIQNFYHL